MTTEPLAACATWAQESPCVLFVQLHVDWPPIAAVKQQLNEPEQVLAVPPVCAQLQPWAAVVQVQAPPEVPAVPVAPPVPVPPPLPPLPVLPPAPPVPVVL